MHNELTHLRADLHRCDARASAARQDLERLARDLPQGWPLLLKRAAWAFHAYRDLAAARERLEAVQSAGG